MIVKSTQPETMANREDTGRGPPMTALGYPHLPSNFYASRVGAIIYSPYPRQPITPVIWLYELMPIIVINPCIMLGASLLLPGCRMGTTM